jgi:hypothetical protein
VCSSGIRRISVRAPAPAAWSPVMRHDMVSRDHFVQHRLSRLWRPKIGIAALENQPERCAAVRLFGLGQVLMPGQRTPEHPEPSRVVPRPAPAPCARSRHCGRWRHSTGSVLRPSYPRTCRVDSSFQTQLLLERGRQQQSLR